MSDESIHKLKEVLARVASPRVLLVEDDPNDADLAKMVLDEQGLVTVRVSSAEEARRAVTTSCFCLCLLDLKLPDVSNPLDLIEELKAQRPIMEIVVLTGTLHDQKLRAALEQRVLAVLLKPIRAEQLRSVAIP